MDDAPPDRLATNPKSPHYDAAALERGVGVRFKGVDRTGTPLTVKVQGSVEPYFRGAPR